MTTEAIRNVMLSITYKQYRTLCSALREYGRYNEDTACIIMRESGVDSEDANGFLDEAERSFGLLDYVESALGMGGG